MTAINDLNWDGLSDQQEYNPLTTPELASDTDEDDELGVDRDEIEEDNLDDDGDDIANPDYNNTIGEDIDYDDDDDSLNEDKDFEAHLQPESVDPDPNEIPEEGESENEGSGYTPSREYDEPQEGNDASYSEQTDVTPPSHREFPAEGPAKTDFEARKQGRTTGRMLGHEPGTEGI